MDRETVRERGGVKILLFGKNGQVGWELQRALAPLGEVVALGREGAGELCGDLEDLGVIAATVNKVRPDVIVNAAAYTAVDKAESERQLAHTINADAPGIMAREAQRSGAWLVHYSTDYVFNGSGTAPWRESDETEPNNVYGRTKLEGEQQIVASGCRHLIFRTSWVYASRGNNFAKTILRLARERDSLKVIDDQTGAPTGADLIADVTAHVLRSLSRVSSPDGVYHLAASGETTWHGYACHIVKRARDAGISLRVSADRIQPIPTARFPTPASRPKNSRLDTAKLRNTFQVAFPAWQNGVDRMLAEILDCPS